MRCVHDAVFEDLGDTDQICQFVATPVILFGVVVGLDGRVASPVASGSFRDQALGQGAVGLPDRTIDLLEVEFDDALCHPGLQFEVQPGRFEGLGEGETVAPDERPGEVHDGAQILFFHTLKCLSYLFGYKDKLKVSIVQEKTKLLHFLFRDSETHTFYLYLCGKRIRVMDLKLRVKELCKQQGILFKELAQKVGITEVGLRQALGGNPTVGTLQKVADALGVEIADLFLPSGLEQTFLGPQEQLVCPHCGKPLTVIIK